MGQSHWQVLCLVASSHVQECHADSEQVQWDSANLIESMEWHACYLFRAPCPLGFASAPHLEHTCASPLNCPPNKLVIEPVVDGQKKKRREINSKCDFGDCDWVKENSPLNWQWEVHRFRGCWTFFVLFTFVDRRQISTRENDYTIFGGKLIKNFRSLVRHERRQLTPQLVLGNLIPGDMNSLLGENKYNPPQNEVEVERPQQQEQSDFIIRCGHKKSEF